MTEEHERKEGAPGIEVRAELGDILGGISRTIQESIRSALRGRGNVLMVRVNDESLKAVDALVEAGLFKTRSEAAAFLIHEGIQSKQDVFQRISDTVTRITEMRESLRQQLHTQGKSPEPPAPGPDSPDLIE